VVNYQVLQKDNQYSDNTVTHLQKFIIIFTS